MKYLDGIEFSAHKQQYVDTFQKMAWNAEVLNEMKIECKMANVDPKTGEYRVYADRPSMIEGLRVHAEVVPVEFGSHVHKAKKGKYQITETLRFPTDYFDQDFMPVVTVTPSFAVSMPHSVVIDEVNPNFVRYTIYLLKDINARQFRKMQRGAKFAVSVMAVGIEPGIYQGDEVPGTAEAVATDEWDTSGKDKKKKHKKGKHKKRNVTDDGLVRNYIQGETLEKCMLRAAQDPMCKREHIPSKWAHDKRLWYILAHESGARPGDRNNTVRKRATNKNPNSTAYGIFQFLDSTWTPNHPKTNNPYLQCVYGLLYIKKRPWHIYDADCNSKDQLENAYIFKKQNGTF